MGKTTLFNALTRAGAGVATYAFSTVEPNTAMVDVPDKRLDALAQMYHPKKVTPTAMKFVDVAGLVAGASRGEGMATSFFRTFVSSTPWPWWCVAFPIQTYRATIVSTTPGETSKWSTWSWRWQISMW